MWGAVFMCLLYECVGLLSVLCVCVCGNYSILNAGNAGETGCLLINERSRWSRVGVSCECTGEPIRWSAQHGHLGRQTNKTSRAADVRPVCVYVLSCDSRQIHMSFIWSNGGYQAALTPKAKQERFFFFISSVSYHRHHPLPLLLLYLSLCDHADSSWALMGMWPCILTVCFIAYSFTSCLRLLSVCVCVC